MHLFIYICYIWQCTWFSESDILLKALIRIHMIAKMLYVYSNTMESSTFIENKIGETKKKKSWSDLFRFICSSSASFNMLCSASLRFSKLKVTVCKKTLHVLYIFFDSWTRISINLTNKVHLPILHPTVWMLRKAAIGWWGSVWPCEGQCWSLRQSLQPLCEYLGENRTYSKIIEFLIVENWI